jgi:hypothetical protein
MKKCQAKASSTGKKCKLRKIIDSEFCRYHQNYSPESLIKDSDQEREMIVYVYHLHPGPRPGVVGQDGVEIVPIEPHPEVEIESVSDIPSIERKEEKVVSTSLEVRNLQWNLLEYRGTPQSPDQGLSIAKETWTVIFDFASILDVRAISMTCKFMKEFSKTYWNTMSSAFPNRVRYYALASVDTEMITVIRGNEDTNFVYSNNICIPDRYMRTQIPCVVDLENKKPLIWNISRSNVPASNEYPMFTRLRTYKSFLMFCKEFKMHEDTVEHILVESRNDPLEMRLAATEFAKSLAMAQILFTTNLYEKSITIEYRGRKIVMGEQRDLLKAVKTKLRENHPEAEILFSDDYTIMAHKKLNLV